MERFPILGGNFRRSASHNMVIGVILPSGQLAT